jgi:hypothetical protein
LTFLACGERYRKSLVNKLKTNEVYKNKNIIVTSDAPDDFKEFGNSYKVQGRIQYEAPTRSRRGGSWFNYHLKSEAIRNAASQGYTKVFYIDSDVEVLEWPEDFLIKKETGAWFRRTLKRMQHPDKYRFYDKVFRLSLWRRYRPVSEKIMFFNESFDNLMKVTETWEQLGLLAEGKIHPASEGHEIRISCKINDINVQTFNPDPFKKAGGNIMRDRSFD